MERLQVYKCEVCGNMVEVLSVGGGTLTCCGKPMVGVTENTVDAAVEKHIPVVEEKDGDLLVKVGEVEHPMLEEHYIQWIEVITKDGQVLRKFINPNEKPFATFKVNGELDRVREYCNLHGLWSKN